MRPSAVIAALSVFLSCSSGGLMGEKWVILPLEKAQRAAFPCSRAWPAGVTGVWAVSAADVRRVEAKLTELQRLRSEVCCLEGARVEEPASYYRQYVGLEILGRRMIYINALRSPEGLRDWRSEVIDVCDGGASFWGALFDPVEGAFLDLAFNGMG